MNRVLSIDPSGTGTSGIFFTNGKEQEFHQFHNKEWTEHYSAIISLVKEKQPTLILYEDTNYIHRKTKDGLSLFRLLGALESLSYLFNLEINSMNVLRVKEMTKKLLNGTEKIKEIEYLQGRGKGWMFNKKRVSIHQLEAFLVYYLWKDKVSINVINHSC